MCAMSVTTCKKWEKWIFLYIFECNSKNIWSIFIKFSGCMDMVISYNQMYIVTMEIHQCGFYGNIYVTLHQIFLHFWSPLKEYLINLHEFFSTYGHCHLLQLSIHCYYGDPSMWFLWQHICHASLNFLTFLITTQRIFDQSWWNFQHIWALSSPTIKHTLLLWISTNVVSMTTYLSQFVKLSYIFDHQSKSIRSIFMKFSEHIGIVISYNRTNVVTMDVHQCCFYGNIFAIHCQIFLHIAT